MCKHEYVNIDW